MQAEVSASGLIPKMLPKELSCVSGRQAGLPHGPRSARELLLGLEAAHFRVSPPCRLVFFLKLS